jgi:hypothetical protein
MDVEKQRVVHTVELHRFANWRVDDLRVAQDCCLVAGDLVEAVENPRLGSGRVGRRGIGASGEGLYGRRKHTNDSRGTNALAKVHLLISTSESTVARDYKPSSVVRQTARSNERIENEGVEIERRAGFRQAL